MHAKSLWLFFYFLNYNATVHAASLDSRDISVAAVVANTRRWTNVDLMLGQRRRRWANLSRVCWRVHNRYTKTALMLLKIILSGLLNSRCTFQYPMGSDFPSRILGSGVQCVTDAIDAKWRSLHPLFPMGSIYQIMSNAILLIGMDINNLQSNNFNWV